MSYDFLIVGAGLFGATLAERLVSKGKKVLVVERKSEVGGMCYTEKCHGITVHKYGAHIFRTSDDNIWIYVNRFAHFKSFINSPLAYVDGCMYNLPFNMNTFNRLWKVARPEDARQAIEADRVYFDEITNLEEFALSTVGKTIYDKFIKEYTEKQWGKKCTDLPASILGRLPLRFTYDNNYYANKSYQGVPEEGYTVMIQNMLSHIDVITGVDDWTELQDAAKDIIYTGSVDELFNYKYGELEYRSLYFDECILSTDNYQGNAVINYPSKDVPYTRIIEHKHFLGEESNVTIISKECPIKYDKNNNSLERYYPIETERNLLLYKKYASENADIILSGRLGQYKYTDMEQTVLNAIELACKLV